MIFVQALAITRPAVSPGRRNPVRRCRALGLAQDLVGRLDPTLPGGAQRR